jgi:hypothetical protein
VRWKERDRVEGRQQREHPTIGAEGVEDRKTTELAPVVAERIEQRVDVVGVGRDAADELSVVGDHVGVEQLAEVVDLSVPGHRREEQQRPEPHSSYERA